MMLFLLCHVVSGSIPLLERCNHKEYLLRSFDKLSSSFEVGEALLCCFKWW